MKLTIQSAVSAFGANAKAKLSKPGATGEPEALDKRPIDSNLTAIALLLAAIFAGHAETTNTLSSAQIEGRQMAQTILAQQPQESVTNVAVLKIRGKKMRREEVHIRVRINPVSASTNSWQACYETTGTNQLLLTIEHSVDRPNRYHLLQNGKPTELDGNAAAIPFANSDFWIADFGMEFLSWPEQKILKKEFHNQCPTALLESINPHPIAGGYSRVVSRVNEENAGIMEARAFDLANRQLKEFSVKDLKKVKGQWQVETMEMLNVQTDSRTRLEFDLEP